MTSPSDLHNSSLPELIVVSGPPASNDPPPPYPSRERRSRATRRRRTLLAGEGDRSLGPLPQRRSSTGGLETEYDAFSADEHQAGHEASETTPLLSPSLSGGRGAGGIRRQRTLSLSSTVPTSIVTSLSPSFSHTILSAFHPERDGDLDPECEVEEYDEADGELVDYPSDIEEDHHDIGGPVTMRHGSHRGRWWHLRRYFRPLRIRAYYSALFHLLILNFPYALVAWVYLFVFTLTGTTTLMALPLGAVLSFLDLLGARALSRGEIALQTTFHGPLVVSANYIPPPIFTRPRVPSSPEAEMGHATRLIPERSFYKNTYAMFTDPTSYQALFYFLVIKPGITLFFWIVLVALVPVSFVLVLPAPAVLRLSRRLGIWQANVAVEGLYLTVR